MKKAWSLAMPYIQIAKIVILFNAHNNSFDWFLAGITGAVRIDDNGDRDADYSLLDLDPVTGRFEVVSHYYGANRWVHWHPLVASQIIQIQFGNQELGISSEQTWVEFKLVFIFALTLWLDSQISTGQDRTMDRRRTCRSVDSWGTTHSVRAMVLKLNLCTSHSMVKSATFSCWVCFLSLRLAASFSYFITFIANKSGLDYDFMCLFVCSPETSQEALNRNSLSNQKMQINPWIHQRRSSCTACFRLHFSLLSSRRCLISSTSKIDVLDFGCWMLTRVFTGWVSHPLDSCSSTASTIWHGAWNPRKF